MDEDKPKGRQTKPELIDEQFADSRLRLEMIITLLGEGLQLRCQKLMEDGTADAKLGPMLDHLERLIFLGQMNRAKVRDLAHMAPKKYQRIMTDAELSKELRPVRDEVNFPKRGPRGPREDVAESPEEET